MYSSVGTRVLKLASDPSRGRVILLKASAIEEKPEGKLVNTFLIWRSSCSSHNDNIVFNPTMIKLGLYNKTLRPNAHMQLPDHKRRCQP